MRPDAVLLVGMAFFQFVGGIILLDRPRDSRIAGRFLGALFFLNGIITLLRAVAVDLGSSPPLGLITHAMDQPTNALLAGALLGVWRPQAARAWVPPLIVLGVGQAVVALLLPNPPPLYVDLWFRAAPYVALVSILLVTYSAGETWARWVALAFLPRALFFGLPGLAQLIANDPLTPTMTNVIHAAFLPACVWCIVRLTRSGTPGAPISTLVAFTSILFTGPVLLKVVPPAATSLVDTLTLGLVRPFVTYVGIFPVRTATRLTLYSLTTAAFVAALALGGDAAGLGASTSFLFALGGGTLLFAALERFMPSLPPEDRSTPPQWERFLLALEGSSDPTAAVRPEWSQRAIARSTRMSVQRVSAMPGRVNVRADEHLAILSAEDATRIKAAAGEPLPLVLTLRGAVPGARSVRVYYRLTPAGEAVVAALRRRPPSPRVDEAKPQRSKSVF